MVKRKVHGIERKDITMRAEVIPGRAWTVIPVILASHLRIIGKGFGIVIQTLSHSICASRPFSSRV